jgi:hypothetical protein
MGFNNTPITIKMLTISRFFKIEYIIEKKLIRNLFSQEICLLTSFLLKNIGVLRRTPGIDTNKITKNRYQLNIIFSFQLKWFNFINKIISTSKDIASLFIYT